MKIKQKWKVKFNIESNKLLIESHDSTTGYKAILVAVNNTLKKILNNEVIES